MNHDIFQSGWWELVLLPALHRSWVLQPRPLLVGLPGWSHSLPGLWWVYPAEYSRGNHLEISRVHSLYHSLLCPANSSHLGLPKPPTPFPQLGFTGLCLNFPPCVAVKNSLRAARQGNCRTHFVFLLLGITVLLCPISFLENQCFFFFFLRSFFYYYFGWEGKPSSCYFISARSGWKALESVISFDWFSGFGVKAGSGTSTCSFLP